MLNNNTTSNRPSGELVLRDLYEQYWRCRDFEIKNLWQRSVFLGAFLILCFTGYGAFFGKAFFDDKGRLILFEGSSWVCHFVAMIITFWGGLFSWLWVCLAKASKAWVEVYERAIVAIEKRMTKTLNRYIGFQYNNISFYPQGGGYLFDESVHSTKGGMFSPSRINVFIGIISLYIMFSLMYVHFVMGVYLKLLDIVISLFKDCGLYLEFILCFFLLFLSLGVVFFVIKLMMLDMSEYIRSKTLNGKEPGRTWVEDVSLLVEFYPKQIEVLSKIRNLLNESVFINGKTSSYAYENGSVYLVYHFTYENIKMKIDISIRTRNSNIVSVEIRNDLNGEIYSKKIIKGKKERNLNDPQVLVKNHFCENLEIRRWLRKLRFRQIDWDGVVKDVVAYLIDLNKKKLLRGNFS